MNSVRYRLAIPWGLHARPISYIVSLATACPPDSEVIVSGRGGEYDAKSIMGVMMLAASYGSEIEFLSLMPAENWEKFTASMESLFFIAGHHGKMENAYDPVEQIIQVVSRDAVPCALIRHQLEAVSTKHDCIPFFERIDEDLNAPAAWVEPRERQAAKPIDFESIDTFISYDSKDFSYASKIYNGLVDRGMNVFFAGTAQMVP